METFRRQYIPVKVVRISGYGHLEECCYHVDIIYAIGEKFIQVQDLTMKGYST